MNLNRRQIAGWSCMAIGTGAYLWLMTFELVPTTVELAANFGKPAPVPAVWIGLTAAALVVVLGLDRALSHKR